MESIQWPEKTREIHHCLLDSTVWNDFAYRDADIVIDTYGKAGTTWVWQIVGQLLFNGDPLLRVGDLSPLMEMPLPQKEVRLEMFEAQTHRWFIRTHLPIGTLRFSPMAKYLYVGRDGRDIVWSLYNHHTKLTQHYYNLVNTARLPGTELWRAPPDNIHTYWRQWLDGDGYPLWPFWEHIRSWWAIRHLPNVMLLHFADLKRDMPGEIRRIAEFLEIPIDETRWIDILDHCSLEWMRQHSHLLLPTIDEFWDGGSNAFFYKGVNGRWTDVLIDEDRAEYEARAESELGAECARWLAVGCSFDGGSSATQSIAQ